MRAVALLCRGLRELHKMLPRFLPASGVLVVDCVFQQSPQGS